MAKGISLPVVQSGLEASIQQGVKNVGQINVPVNIDPTAFKNLAQPLGRVSGLATEFEKSIAASNARVLAFGASVGIINGVQNAFASLVKTGIEVQKTFKETWLKEYSIVSMEKRPKFMVKKKTYFSAIFELLCFR